MRRRRNRARPTPKWLLSRDEVGKARCLMVLSVLSGEKPVTDAISEAGISRATYYHLETRALSSMLRALAPGAEETDEALAWGFVNRVVADAADTVPAALELARLVTANPAFAVRLTKEMLRSTATAATMREAVLLENCTQVVAVFNNDIDRATTQFRARA